MGFFYLQPWPYGWPYCCHCCSLCCWPPARLLLQLLEERDAELERVDTVMAGLKEAATTREAALQETRRTLSDKEAALRDREARWVPFFIAVGVGEGLLACSLATAEFSESAVQLDGQDESKCSR